jgi:hypothetical protein
LTAPSDIAPSSPDATDSTAADTKQLEDLRHGLESHRTQAFDKSVSELDAHGTVLYFKTYPRFNPVLHRLDERGVKLEYRFGIGEGDDNNYRASTDLVVTAQRMSETIVYLVYDARAANKELGRSALSGPSDQKWWPYAVSGSTVYVITSPTEATGNGHVVWSFQAGSEPNALFTLEEAGVEVGELLDFAVDGTTLMVIESGRLWRVDLGLKQAKFMGNTTEISGAVEFSGSSVVWEDSTGLKYVDGADGGAVRDLSKEIQAAAYKINDTYYTGHYFSSATKHENFGRYKDWVLYTANTPLGPALVLSREAGPAEPGIADDQRSEGGSARVGASHLGHGPPRGHPHRRALPRAGHERPLARGVRTASVRLHDADDGALDAEVGRSGRRVFAHTRGAATAQGRFV